MSTLSTRGTKFSARILQSSELISRKEYQACQFPFKRDYGMGPRRVPSSAGLPDCWNEEMDRFICFSEAVGDTPTRMVILSLKKRFPELNQFTLSEIAIERRVTCLDSMENNYFKKGSYIAVQRLESAGVTLPEPWYGPDDEALAAMRSQNISPVPSSVAEKLSTTQPGAIRMVSNVNNEPGAVLSARYASERYINKDDPFTATHGRTPLEVPPSTPRKSINSNSTIRLPAHDNVTTRSLAPVAKSSASNLRPGQEISYRAKDIAPAASLSRLRVSEDDSQLEGSGSHAGNSKHPSMESTATSSGYSYHTRRGGPTPPNDASGAWNTSYGSPRTPAGRVRPTPLKLNLGSTRREHDENIPLTNSTAADDGSTTLSSRRYI
ncbi:MAG: hypothetical protein Q9224_003589 [Gallowayella concinna]